MPSRGRYPPPLRIAVQDFPYLYYMYNLYIYIKQILYIPGQGKQDIDEESEVTYNY